MRFRILLAEDNAADRMAMEKMLAELGCRTDIVTNGSLAVEAVRRNDYDLVVMSRHLPFLDGCEATSHIRDFRSRRQLPVVAITGHTGAEDFDLCVAVGIDDLLQKPVSRHKLHETLCRWIAGYEHVFGTLRIAS